MFGKSNDPHKSTWAALFEESKTCSRVNSIQFDPMTSSLQVIAHITFFDIVKRYYFEPGVTTAFGGSPGSPRTFTIQLCIDSSFIQ
jgi:hypothetical protein